MFPCFPHAFASSATSDTEVAPPAAGAAAAPPPSDATANTSPASASASNEDVAEPARAAARGASPGLPRERAPKRVRESSQERGGKEHKLNNLRKRIRRVEAALESARSAAAPSPPIVVRGALASSGRLPRWPVHCAPPSLTSQGPSGPAWPRRGAGEHAARCVCVRALRRSSLLRSASAGSLTSPTSPLKLSLLSQRRMLAGRQIGEQPGGS